MYYIRLLGFKSTELRIETMECREFQFLESVSCPPYTEENDFQIAQFDI